MNIMDYDNIVWQGNDYDEDYTVRLGDYFLHVEKMHKKNWWWGVSLGDDYNFLYGNEEHKETAMIKAEMNAKIHYLYQLISNK